jgi:hypothetical protein
MVLITFIKTTPVLNPVQDLSLSLANVAKGKRSLGQNLRFASSGRSGLQLSVPME